MGNRLSRAENLSAAAIEKMYAARAAAASASSQRVAKDLHENAFGDNTDSVQPKKAPDSNNVDAGNQARNSLDLQHNNFTAIQRTAEALRGAVPQDLAVSAACYITIAVRAFHDKSAGAFDYAIAQLKKMGIINVAKVIGHWIKAHPWETAALIVPLILVACTPAIFGAVGFGTGGIVAGSIAAGLQAGIGNVAAGSTFAVLTSAMMGGGGLPVVLGGVWGISTAVMGGIALWKRWSGAESRGHDNAARGAYLAIEGSDDNEDRSDGGKAKRIKED
ncbi:hypothetical protein NX059_006493 [Plenodomus lindquistii]|nr:hypothetical protein NX059_006493 [Plenodomus lindquistii]